MSSVVSVASMLIVTLSGMALECAGVVDTILFKDKLDIISQAVIMWRLIYIAPMLSRLPSNPVVRLML